MFRCRACSAAFSQNADLVLHNRNVQCTLLTPPVTSNVITSGSVNDQSSMVQETLLTTPTELSDRDPMHAPDEDNVLIAEFTTSVQPTEMPVDSDESLYIILLHHNIEQLHILLQISSNISCGSVVRNQNRMRHLKTISRMTAQIHSRPRFLNCMTPCFGLALTTSWCPNTQIQCLFQTLTPPNSLCW